MTRADCAARPDRRRLGDRVGQVAVEPFEFVDLFVGDAFDDAGSELSRDGGDAGHDGAVALRERVRSRFSDGFRGVWAWGCP